MISEHLSSILTKGLDALLEENRKDDLKLMYSLLGRVKSGHQELKGTLFYSVDFSPHMRTACFIVQPFYKKKVLKRDKVNSTA